MSKYAVIKTGGKQYRVKEGDVLNIEKVQVETGGSIAFDEVLMTSDGENTVIGAPLVTGASVEASVVAQIKDKKVLIIKFKRRKNHLKRQGHKQSLTKIEIKKINA